MAQKYILIMKTSINPINQKSYNIPESLDDSKQIEEFLSINAGKKIA